MKHPYRPLGVDEQGRYPEAAHAACEEGMEDTGAEKDAATFVIGVCVALAVWACAVAWVVAQ